MSFARNFAAGQQIAQTAMDAYDSAKMGSILKEAKEAKPESIQQFSEDDASALHSAAQSGKEVQWSEQVGGYMVKPSAGKAPDAQNAALDAAPPVEAAGPPQTFAPTEHTSFLGNKTAGKFSDEQIREARAARIESGAASLFSPARGLKMVADLKASERDDFKFGLIKTEAERLKTERAKEDSATEAEKKAWIASPYGQAMDKFGKELHSWQAQSQERAAAAAAGAPMEGPEPVQPQMPAVSQANVLLSQLQSTQARMAAGGKVDMSALAAAGKALKTAQDEGVTSVLRAAQDGATIEQIAKMFDGQGTMRFDPASVTSDTTVQRADGMVSRVIQYTNPVTGKTETIDTMADLSALGKAGEYYKRAVDGLDARGKAALRQSQISLNNARAGMAATSATGGATGAVRSGGGATGGKAPKSGFAVAADYLEKFNPSADPTLRIAATNLARTAFELNPGAAPEEVANAAQMAASNPHEVKPRLDFASGRTVMAYVDAKTGQKTALYSAPGGYQPTPEDKASFRSDVTAFLTDEERKQPGMQSLLIGAATENNGGREALQSHFSGQIQQDWMNAWEKNFAATRKASPTRLDREQALATITAKAAKAASEHMRRYDSVLSMIKQYGAPRSARP